MKFGELKICLILISSFQFCRVFGLYVLWREASYQQKESKLKSYFFLIDTNILQCKLNKSILFWQYSMA